MKARSPTAFGSLLGLSLLLCLHSDGDQFSSTPRDDFWMPGAGGVGKVLEASGVVYVGGGFRVLIPSPPSGAGAYDVNSGARDQDFPKTNVASPELRAQVRAKWKDLFEAAPKPAS